MDDVFVGRLMSSPVTTVTVDANAERVAQRMLAEKISSVVVVDDDGHLEGILTSTDFVKITAQGKSTADVSVAAYMTTDVTTVTVNDDIESAADLMVENDVHHLPVVDDTEGVIGMLTTTDFTAYIAGIVETPPPIIG